MIKILIIDDSPTEIALLKELFKAEPDMEVIGSGNNGEEAIKLTALLKPDIITMDIQMPIMNGVDATRIIMAQQPIPIVIISSAVNDQSLDLTFQALEAGALSVLEKPDNTKPQYKKLHKRIVDVVRSMSEIKVVKKRFLTPKDLISQKTPIVSLTRARHYEIIAIGSSVGGPQALKTILSALPNNFPVPILVVQHMTPGFIKGFADWLNTNSPLQIKEAKDLEILHKGTVYFAPENHHLEVKREQGKLIAKLSNGKPVSGFYPSITVLFKSVAKTCENTAIGILLTGMGCDGAEGLLALKQANAHTIIQDPKSAIVFGMAGVAQSMGAVDKVVKLDQMANYLMRITK